MVVYKKKKNSNKEILKYSYFPNSGIVKEKRTENKH